MYTVPPWHGTQVPPYPTPLVSVVTTAVWCSLHLTLKAVPTAASGTLGGVKVGTNLSIDGNGVLSANVGSYTLPTAGNGSSGNEYSTDMPPLGEGDEVWWDSGVNPPTHINDGIWVDDWVEEEYRITSLKEEKGSFLAKKCVTEYPKISGKKNNFVRCHAK